MLAETPPANSTCKLCGVLSTRLMQLPCSHIFCETCSDQVHNMGFRCPLDGRKFFEEEVTVLVTNQEELRQIMVHCDNALRGCEFVGPLCKLSQHLKRDCFYHAIRCVKCGHSVLRTSYMNHFLSSCSGHAIAPATPPSTALVAVDLERSRSDIEAAATKISQGRMVVQDSVNSLLECLADYTVKTRQLEDFLTSQAEGELNNVFSGRIMGNKSATCCIGNFYQRRNRITPGYTTLAHSKRFMVDGYTLKVSSQFLVQGDSTMLTLSLIVCDGAWDSLVQWPFRRICTLVLVHPLDSRKNLRRTFSTEDMVNKYRCFRKPIPGYENDEFARQLLDSEEVESSGFVVNDSICVTVELRRS